MKEFQEPAGPIATIPGRMMQIHESKFAALVRHFAQVKFEEGDRDCYQLTMPLEEWLTLPEGTQIYPADNPSWHSGKPSTVAFIVSVPKEKTE